ncbi:hypothetical protein K3495_g1746 [Podosphaera aphanis]|nr:hypothetical protein K3495_g1746 [Podosphaera aphanis]
MASLNTATNGPSIKSSYQSVINSPAPSGAAAKSPTYGQWAIFSVSAPLINAFKVERGEKESILKVQSTGEGELIDLIEEFSEGRVQFAFVRVKDTNTELPKYVLIGWCGEGVPERTRGYFHGHLAAAGKIFHGYHVQITARSDRDLTPEIIIKKVADASGAKYSAGSSLPLASNNNGPTVALKPAFKPTQSSKPSLFNPLAGSRPKPDENNINVDDDGWGADAPQVTRSQLEKVPSAYKPTKVNMAELTKNIPAPTQFSSNGNRVNDNSDVIKGGYQPIGKVDIAAIRAQAQNKTDDRPTVVKGAYEPVGKVDISAIRAKAQKPANESSRNFSAPDESKAESVANRSAIFSQSERLTALPKPKVTKKFGPTSSSFAGTKPPNPGAFGLHSAPAAFVTPIIGTASKTFADEGGKTPAQLWQEKKARERGSNTTSNGTTSVISPIASQTSGGTEWKSGYTGKSWAPVSTNPTGRSASISQNRKEEEESEETPSSGGIGAIRDRFQSGGIPRTTSGDSSPPPINSFSRPAATMPPPPPQARSPTPESPQRDVSPVRIAMPVARSTVPEIEAAEELSPPPALPPSIIHKIPTEEELTDEPASSHLAHGAAVVSESNTIKNSSTNSRSALIQYDYEKAEENELELVEGQYVTDIDMVDDDWWMGTNSKGETGLFPSNYVELLEENAPSEIALRPVAPAEPSGPSATALYDYEAAEDNELSFEEDAVISNIEFPDEDWWHGHYNGNSGLFPANYVQLNE